MSGDYVQRLRAFLDAREARGGAWRGTISVAHGDGARTGEGPGMYRRPLTDVDLRAALDELEQLRAERSDEPKARCDAQSNTRLSLQCSRPEGHDAAHVADLDGMGRFSWHGA